MFSFYTRLLVRVSSRPPLLHLGGPKTGSTSLQIGVFRKASDLYNFGEVGDGVTTVEDEACINGFLTLDEQFIDSRSAFAVVSYHVDVAGSRRVVYSSADVLRGNSPSRASKRLGELFGTDCTVLLVVRNQIDALISYYAGHGAWLKPAPRPYFGRFVKFSEWLSHQKLLLPDSWLRTFAYWEQIEPFIKVFGIDNVTVLTYEALREGDSRAWKSFAHFSGIPADVARQNYLNTRRRQRPSVAQTLARRIEGKLGLSHESSVRLSLPIWILARPVTPRVQEAELQDLSHFYGLGNRRLDDLFALSLSKYSYPGI